MVSMRTIAVFLIACSAILLTIAIQKYLNAVETAEAIAEHLEGIEFESVSLPIESSVCGFVAVLMFVAGVRLLFESRHGKGNQPKESSLL